MNVPLAYFPSLRSGRPVKMIMSYTEELMAGNPRHPAVVTIKTGVKSDGTFWARHSTVVYNGGAYSGLQGPPRTRRQPGRAGGQYHIPHVQVDSYMVYTHNVPCGSYRAPGQPQVVFAVESHTDMIAHEMGIDPYALRLRNVLQDGQVCATGGRYKHVRGGHLRAAVAAANWGRRSLAQLGRGLSLGQRPQGQSVYSVTVSMDEHARVTFYTLVPETGTGAHTVGRSGAPGDPGRGRDRGPEGYGRRSYGCRRGQRQQRRRDPCRAGRRPGRASTTHLPGRRVLRLAGRADRLPQGSRVRRGDPDQGVPIQEASRAVAAAGAPISFAMTTEAKEPDVTCFSAQVAEVEVDPETGAIKVRKFVTAHDVGTIHNPMTHQGQIDGAIMQGVGYALMEQLASEEGHISTLSMGEVKTPTMQDMPELVTVLVESPGGNGPYGAKTIGEQPLPPVAPAIANAVYDAVGVRIQDLPITAEKCSPRYSKGDPLRSRPA